MIEQRTAKYSLVRVPLVVRAQATSGYIRLAPLRLSDFFTTLAFWLRSSVVSVLNSLTTIMGAPPSLLVI